MQRDMEKIRYTTWSANLSLYLGFKNGLNRSDKIPVG